MRPTTCDLPTPRQIVLGNIEPVYPQRDFRVTDPGAIHAFIRKHPLAMVAGIGSNGGLVATHIPLLIHQTEPELVLRGHVMRKTDHWHALKENPQALAVFTGPDAPVMESWQSVLPFGGTWNYMAVHARGAVAFLPEVDLRDLLQRLKDQFEESPDHKFANLAEEYVSRLVPAIECLEIRVSSLEAVFKLSQNRTEQDFDSTVRHLTDQGGESALVAEEMLARRGAYFPSNADSS